MSVAVEGCETITNERDNLKAQLDGMRKERDLLAARVRDLETCMRREQQDHIKEYNDLLKELKRRGG